MKKFIAILVGLILLAYAIDLSQKNAVVLPHVKQHIQETSRGYVSEAISCLDYTEIDGTLVIYDYDIPQHYKQTQDGVHSDFCKRDQMPLHNHPSYYKPQDLVDYYFIATGDSLTYKWQMLYMSGPDIRSAVKFYPEYTAVSANGSFGWWTRSQYRRAFLNKKILLKPVIDQTLWYRN